jgi:hypothetical protein
MTENNRILASVALFSELYDKNQDVYHLVGEFIKSVIISEKVSEFNADEANRLLREHFDFDLPPAVVRTVLRKRLKSEGFCRSVGNGYRVVDSGQIPADTLREEFEKLKSNYEEIIRLFIEHTHNNLTGGDSADEIELTRSFYSFLLGDPVREEHARFCSAFIVDHRFDEVITDGVNLIREGLVVYSGVMSAQGLNELGSWRSNLTVVLDTELLLDMHGLNGETHGQIFADFHNLVKEVNNSNQSKGIKARINLKYFHESGEEIDRIFAKAENVVAGREKVQVATRALQAIMDGCASASDVLTRKVLFFNRLETENIRAIDERSVIETMQFNVESKELLVSIPSEIRQRREFDEKDFVARFRQFTVINSLRGGISSTQIETCGALLLTRDRLTRSLASNPKVRINPKDFPFAIDIDFVINRLWFNLNKGFRDKSALPKSFDMVSRAQIVLASQMRSAIARRYAEIIEKKDNGELRQEDFAVVFAEIRSREIEPERIDENVLDEILDFIADERDVASKIQELKSVKEQANETTKLRAELVEKSTDLDRALAAQRRLAIEKFQRLRRRNSRSRKIVNIVSIAVLLLLSLGAGLIVYISVKWIQADSDTPLSIILGILGVGLSLIPLIKNKQALSSFVKRKVNFVYRGRARKSRERGFFRLK